MELVNQTGAGVMVGDVLLFILLYADDIVLISDNELDLQNMLNKVELFCNQSGTTANISKTQWIVFERCSSKETEELDMNFSGRTIARADSFKYLGIFFSSTLSFTDQVRYALIKAEKAAFISWKYIGRFISMNTSLRLNLFNTVVTPILLYCSEIWFPCLSQADVDSIERFYLKNLKRILGVPHSTATSAIYQELGQTSISEIVKQSGMEFLCKLKLDPTNWSLLKSLMSTDCNWTRYCISILQPHDLSIYNIDPTQDLDLALGRKRQKKLEPADFAT